MIRLLIIESINMKIKNQKSRKIIEPHILKSYNMDIDEFSRYLAEKYIFDKRQKKIFLDEEMRTNVKLNYVAGLLLKQRGKEVFTPLDIREIIRNEIIPSISEISDRQLSGILLTSDLRIDLGITKWNNGYPCLDQIRRGFYKFIGFSD